MDFSVVVPTRNRCEALRVALTSILEQRLEHGRFEVLVVDNGSTDGTRALVDELRARHPGLAYHHAAEPGLHVGRHKGLRESRGDILVYVDDDIRAAPGWLAGLREAMADPRVAMAGGRVLPEWGATPPDWIRRLWEQPQAEGRVLPDLSILDLGDRPRPIPPTLVFGCNFAVRRSVLLAAGGFHPDGFPQELIRFRGDGESWVSAYVEEQGLLAFYHPDASIQHCIPASRLTAGYFRQRQFNQGISDSYTAIRRAGGLRRAGLSSKVLRRRLRRSLRRLLGRVPANFAAIPDSEIQRELRQSHDEGYEFHQQAVRRDPRLLAWVLQKSYF